MFEENGHSEKARRMLGDWLVGRIGEENYDSKKENHDLEYKEQRLRSENHDLENGKHEEQNWNDKNQDLQYNQQDSKSEKKVDEADEEKKIVAVEMDARKENVVSESPSVKVFFGSQKGTARSFANQLREKINEAGQLAQVVNLGDYEPEDFPNEKSLIVFILATYTDGSPTENAKFFLTWLRESVQDFRVTHGFLKNIKYTVFGLGNSIYENQFNKVALDFDELLQSAGAFRFFKNGVGDDNVARDDLGTQAGDFEEWSKMLTSIIGSIELNATYSEVTFPVSETQASCACCNTGDSIAASACCKKETNDSGPCCSTDVLEEKQEEEEYVSDEEYVEEDEPVVDVEDLGVFSKNPAPAPSKREMVTPEIRKSLTKQGYRILGSHSGVKLCRWNKAMLRGRGGCYKHTFYGIKSYCCMEMTPSLACANKCVFCWRHHSNPVGKEWKWVTDPPEFLIEQAIQQHLLMIKQMKGVPGVKKECFEEAQTVKHCALSLVGEPIMYPHINKFVSMLHEREISTFMVTNAQFPDCIRDLQPVTQLYVSVDAATPESLKAVDRPLFKDFWERFNKSLEELAKKPCRSVYRLTLVKSFNMEEVANYSSLILRGLPDFVEIKGVTFCGNNDASSLTMGNVPYHIEVIAFANALLTYISDEYALACEHAHSCCLLICNKKFLKNNKWYTWIDYPKFFELVRSGQPFTSLDYCAETPDWAVFGHDAAGFDPEQERTIVKGSKKRELKDAQSQIAEVQDEDYQE